MAGAIPARSEAEAKYCWSIEDLFPSDGAWEEEFAACRDLPGQVAAYAGRLGESAQTLFAYLERQEAVRKRVYILNAYAYMRRDEDSTDSVHQAMNGRMQSFLTELQSAASFEGPELTAIPEETLEAWYREYPPLEKYRRYLTRSRLEKDHTLTPGEESLLASAGEVLNGAHSIYSAYHDADMTFPPAKDSRGEEHTVTQSAYGPLLQSQDRTLRKNAYKSCYGAYGASRNAFAAMLDAQVRGDVFYARARKYPSALAAALTPVEVPEEVYHNLLSAVRANLDSFHRYMGLRKRAMGLDEMHIYDLSASIVPGEREKIPFEQACRDLLEAVSVLGGDYRATVKRALDERWVDVYENRGKRSGAYSFGTPVHSFILMSYKETLSTEFTLAHEMGHAMHSYLSYQNQSYTDANYVLFVAEVASTVNEALLMQYLLRTTTDRKRRAVLVNHFLDQFRSTLYRQAMFADFELQIHRLVENGETLTSDRLCALYYDLNRSYYGPEVFCDEECALEWARIPHFYLNYYVYQYATGFSAAMALSKRLLEGGEKERQDYLRFLSAGCSKDPISLLKIAGVDMSTPRPVEDALAQFDGLIGEMEELLS